MSATADRPMEKGHLDNLIKRMKQEGEKKGIQLVEVLAFIQKNVPRVILSVEGDVHYNETDEEALLEIGKVIELARHMNLTTLLYYIDENVWEKEPGHRIIFYLSSWGIIYQTPISFLDYINNQEKRFKDIEEKLKKVKDAVEGVFGTSDFDPETIVENSLWPSLKRNNITQISRFTTLNPIINSWWDELLGIENSSDFFSDLGDYYCIDDGTLRNYIESPFNYSSEVNLFQTILCLIPYMYEKEKSKGAIIKERIKRLDLSVLSKIMKLEANEHGPEEVEKITSEFLNLREGIGIRNRKVTKQEVEDYIRVLQYDGVIPREMLKNAIFDKANRNEQDY